MIYFKHKKYVLIVNMGNYTVDSGGTNKVVFAQQKILNENQFSVMCIYPYKSSEYTLWGVLIDGKFKGVIDTESLLGKIAKYSKEGYILQKIIIHHLIRSNLKSLEVIIRKLKVSTCIYIHDFYMICPHQYLMIHSNGRQCESHYVGDKDCKTCCYKVESESRSKEIRHFILSVGTIDCVIAPSEIALKQWCLAFPEFKGEKKIIPHQKMLGNFEENNHIIESDIPIKIGFVGKATEGKGWHYWNDAVNELFLNGKKYEFHMFGDGAPEIKYVKSHRIVFQEKENAMIDALRKAEIDCVVLWSLVKETYSYTYFESWASNAFILTNKNSGNIALEVEMNKNGIVADNPNELYSLLEDENKLREQINAYRQTRTYAPLLLEDNDSIVNIIPDINETYDFIIPKKSIKQILLFLNIQMCAFGELIIKQLKSYIKSVIK